MRPLALATILVWAHAAGAQVRTYSAGQADTILAEVHDALLAYHPFAFRGDGAARLDSAHAALRASLPDLAVGDGVPRGRLIAHAAGFNRVIGDGHLQFRPVLDTGYLRRRPGFRYDLHARRVAGGSFVVLDTLALTDATVVPRGARWLSLEGRAAPELVEELGAFFGIDDHGNVAARELYPAYAPAAFYQRLYGLRDSLAVAFAVAEDTLAGYVAPVEEPGGEGSRGGPFGRGRRRRARLAEYLYLDTTATEGVYRLVVRSFSTGAFGKANPYRRVRRLFRRLDSLGARGLLIDVRNNTGGSAGLVDYVFGHVAERPYAMVDEVTGHSARALGRTWYSRVGNRLFGGVRADGNGGYYVKRAGKTTKPERRRRFGGPVVVLTNEITFSGGSALAHYVQHYGRGAVVGQVPGGSAERMYARELFAVYVGPDDELEIHMPLWYMDMVGEARGNVRPDVVVPRVREDIVDGRDAALEAALDLLKSEGVP